MWLRLPTIAVVTFCATAALANGPQPFDITDVKDELVALDAGQGRTVIIVPNYTSGARHFFYGTRDKFYLQRVPSSGSSGNDSFEFSFWDPRITVSNYGGFKFKNGEFTIRCDDRITVLKPVSAELSKKMVASGKFFHPLWTRRSFLLARDDRGNYYFVDRGREEASRDFRVFKGPRGKMKLMKMKNIVYDSGGAIFSTTRGDLRLIMDKKASWVHGKKRTDLLYLPLFINRQLIYNELGPYSDKRLGTPCDDL
jgi:hypothetical protein